MLIPQDPQMKSMLDPRGSAFLSKIIESFDWWISNNARPFLLVKISPECISNDFSQNFAIFLHKKLPNSNFKAYSSSLRSITSPAYVIGSTFHFDSRTNVEIAQFFCVKLQVKLYMLYYLKKTPLYFISSN